MFEHDQLLAQHKEACVMAWRSRSGNPIALRAQEGSDERRQTSAAGPAAPRRAKRARAHTRALGPQREEIRDFLARQ